MNLVMYRIAYMKSSNRQWSISKYTTERYLHSSTFPYRQTSMLLKQWTRKLYRIYSSTENIRLCVFISVTLNKYRDDCFFVYLFIRSLLRARANFFGGYYKRLSKHSFNVSYDNVYALPLFFYFSRALLICHLTRKREIFRLRSRAKPTIAGSFWQITSRHWLTLVRTNRVEGAFTCQIRLEPVKRRLAVSRDSIRAPDS